LTGIIDKSYFSKVELKYIDKYELVRAPKIEKIINQIYFSSLKTLIYKVSILV